MSDLQDIVARARHEIDYDYGELGRMWVFMYEELVEELEPLIVPPDPPQVHIPGLDQTEWKCVSRTPRASLTGTSAAGAAGSYHSAWRACATII